jgi:amino acid transporter
MGIFGSVYQASGGMPALAYTIGMVALILTAASYAQMVKAFPIAGSVYNYASRGIAPPVGFLAGWAALLDYFLVPGLLYLIAAVAMHAIVPLISVTWWLVAFVGINTAVNLLGIRMSAAFTTLMLIGELVVLGLFVGTGLWVLAHGRGQGFSFAPLYNPGHLSWSVAFGAVSVAVLSFLGFDGISMLAEENRGGAREIGRAMVAALLLAGTLFITQTWVASLFVTDPDKLMSEGDPGGTAFYDAAFAAGGFWLRILTAAATAIAWGVADSLVAQVATSRLLYAMARDRQLPKLLAKVSVRHSVPTNAIVTTALGSLSLGLYMQSRNDGIALMSTLVNFGALAAFLVLHVAVVWHYLVRRRSRNLLLHLVVPVLGFTVLVFVVVNAKLAAQRLGFVWIGLGLVVLAALYLGGRRPHWGEAGSYLTE